MIAMLLEDMVEDLGHEVAGVAATLGAGLAQARELAIDLAILDVNLGNVASYEIAETLSARGIPFIVSSGYGANVDHPAFHGRPTVGKPFVMDDLSNKIEIAMQSNRPPMS